MARAITAQGRRRRLRQGGRPAPPWPLRRSRSRRSAGIAFAARGFRPLVAVAPTALAPVAQIVAHPVGGGSSVVVSGAQAPLDEGRLLGAGSRVVTPANGRAMLSFSTGSTVLLREGTDMTVATEGAAQVLRLDAGSVELHVAKLTSTQRFLVDTPDSEVEVRGTRFSVSVVPPDPACGAGVRTRVAVSEGVVVVRHAGVEDRVALGEAWPAGCTRIGPSTAMAGVRSASNTPTPAALPAGSTLADQNDLFAAAAAANRRGDTRAPRWPRSIAFLATYPASPLVESALVERMRLLQSTSRGRSSAAAKEYLARYPNGFAHAEAEAIVAGAL